MKKKFAYIIMGSHYEPEIHQMGFETEKQITSVFAVKNYAAAKELIFFLEREGYGAIELCGAFGEEKAKELIALTENRMAVGYVTHFDAQDSQFKDFFGK